jgi:predicted nucleic acid-binding protein
MIAADTSTWVAFLQGDSGQDVDLLDRGLTDRQVCMLPVVLTELLSDAGLSPEVAQVLCELPMVDIDKDYWRRTALLRAKVLAKGRRARLGDALIAQSCMDHDISLLTRDRDFRTFAQAAGLGLVIGSTED